MRHDLSKRGGGENSNRTEEKQHGSSFMKNCRLVDPMWSFHICWACFPSYRKPPSDYPKKIIS
jgi:hypothetical protein